MLFQQQLQEQALIDGAITSASAATTYAGSIISSSAYTFVPCRTYTISVYAKVATCTGSLKIEKVLSPSYSAMVGAGPTDILVNFAGTFNVASTTYALYTANFTVSTTETKYIGFLMSGGGCGGVGSMFIDDVTLVEDAGTTCTSGTASASVTSIACSGGTTSLSLAGNTASPATIQWQSSPDNITWTNISTGTTSPYTASVYQTTYFRAIVSKNCLTSTSNTLTVTVTGTSTKTWLTAGTTAWNTAANWSPSGVPTACNDVIIPSGGTQPTTNATANCRNLTVNSGATLTLGSLNFNIFGDFTNNGNVNDGSGYTNLYGTNNIWGGTGTYVNGATQNGWICMKDGSNYTLANTLSTIKYLGGTSITTATTGSLNLSSYTIPVFTGLYNLFNLHYNTGMIDLKGGGSIDVTKSDYGTGTLWVDSPTNGFGFNLSDDYYNAWFTNSGGSTSFGASAVNVFISHNMWLKTTGTVDLSAAGTNKIEVGGDFTNDATLIPASATIYMNGSIAQNIAGTTTTTFSTLTIDNSNASGVTLQQNANTSSVLNLTNAPLNLNSHTFIVQNAGNTAISRTNGYIVSETNASVNSSILQWNIGATNGSYIIPFGVSGSYIPFTFNKTAGNSNMQFSTRATSANDNLPLAGISSVAAVSNMNSYALGGANGSIPSTIDRWWDITALSGTTSVTADLTFSYRGSENTTTSAPTGTFAAQHWNGASWDAQVGSGTGVTSGTGTVSVSGANTFSPWVLTSSLAPLPIELLSNEASCNNKNVVFKWTTATETNNNYFTIERSIDGINSIAIGTVAGAGNSQNILNYLFTDFNSFNGTSYYRLKQTDYNGDSKTFGIITVSNCNSSDINLNAFNSQDGNISIIIDNESAITYTARLFDAQGKKLRSKVLETAKGLSNFQMDITNINKGIYFLTIDNGISITSKKIFVN